MATRKTILLIDDDRDMHDAVRRVLEPEGYRIESALTGPAGLDAARRIRPDLILLDVMLTEPSEGFHLAYEMKRDDALSEIPIVFLSAIAERTGMNFAAEQGSDYLPAEGFIDKPFDPAGLRESVRRALSAVHK